MLQHALKEWAVICEALGQGRQAILLRKGGIAETGGEFNVEEMRFWLFPTYTHQQTDGVNDELKPLLEEVLVDRPPAGIVRLRYWAEVTGLFRIGAELSALLLSHLHGWSEEAVRMRFNYRAPGLNLLAVRVYRAAMVHEVPELPRYAGCHSWVELEAPLPTEGSTPVLDEDSYHIVMKQLDLLLNPTAFA